MINLIKKDLIISCSNKRTNIMMLLYFPLILLILGTENIDTLFIFSTFSFSFLLTKIPFSYEVKDKSHIFVQSLPVTKKDIVLSKYIGIFINFTIGIVYTMIYMWMISLFGLIDVDRIEILTILSTLGFTILTLSISLPFQFRFSPKIANFLNMFFYMIMIILITLDGDIILRFLNFDIGKFENVLGLAGGIIAIYLISIKLSIWLYKTRKFY